MLNCSGQLVLIGFGTARNSTYTDMAKQQAEHKITAIASAGFTPPEQANGHAVPLEDSTVIALIASLKRREVSEEVIHEALSEITHR